VDRVECATHDADPLARAQGPGRSALIKPAALAISHC
jgi:hypothetical protein